MILDALFRVRPVKTPPPKPSHQGFDVLMPNDSGVRVDQHSALQMSAVYACIRLLSETLAQLPLNIRRRTPDGSELATSHPLYDILHNTPNRWMTSFGWRNSVMGHCVGWGNGYSYIFRNQLGEPRALLPLLPDRTYPEIIDNCLTYQTQINEVPLAASPDDVLHIPALGFDGLIGISPIALHRESIGLAQSAQKFGAKLFGSGSLVAGVLKHPGRLRRKSENPEDPSPVDRLRRQWNDLYSGLDNAHSVAVLEEGMEFQRIGINPEDAQFLQTRKFQVAEIGRIYNVPSHMINDLEKATFNNISELYLGFLRYTMTPWIVRWEQELNRKLFPGSNTYYVKFNLQGLLRGTLTERKDYYKTAIEYGWLSRNEVRELEDLNRADGLDEYLRPLNMGSGQDDGNDPTPQQLQDEAPADDT